MSAKPCECVSRYPFLLQKIVEFKNTCCRARNLPRQKSRRLTNVHCRKYSRQISSALFGCTVSLQATFLIVNKHTVASHNMVGDAIFNVFPHLSELFMLFLSLPLETSFKFPHKADNLFSPACLVTWQGNYALLLKARCLTVPFSTVIPHRNSYMLLL